MGYCNNCDEYFKKVPVGKICRKCSNKLCGTPPGINSFEARYMKELETRTRRKAQIDKFYASASLLDVAAIALLNDHIALNILIQNLPEGHPPWHSLLKAWYIINRFVNIPRDKYPKAKFMKKICLELRDQPI